MKTSLAHWNDEIIITVIIVKTFGAFFIFLLLLIFVFLAFFPSEEPFEPSNAHTVGRLWNDTRNTLQSLNYLKSFPKSISRHFISLYIQRRRLCACIYVRMAWSICDGVVGRAGKIALQFEFMARLWE